MTARPAAPIEARRAARAVAGLLAIAAALLTIEARATPAIGPGQEALVGEMLGAGDGDIAGCKLDGASIERVHVDARFRCPAGEAKITLKHRDEAGEGATLTREFAVSGAPPALLEAVVSRVRQHEGRFRWLATDEPSPRGAAAGPVRASPPHLSRAFFPSLLAGALVMGALLFAARRRDDRTTLRA